MAYSQDLAAMVRIALAGKENVDEISMFGGRCFMLNGKMVACAGREEILFRIGAANHDESAEAEGTRLMANNTRIMRGFLFVSHDVLQTEEQFHRWIDLCLRFNDELMATEKSAKKRTS